MGALLDDDDDEKWDRLMKLANKNNDNYIITKHITLIRQPFYTLINVMTYVDIYVIGFLRRHCNSRKKTVKTTSESKKYRSACLKLYNRCSGKHLRAAENSVTTWNAKLLRGVNRCLKRCRSVPIHAHTGIGGRVKR